MHLSCQILLYQELILPDTPLFAVPENQWYAAYVQVHTDHKDHWLLCIYSSRQSTEDTPWLFFPYAYDRFRWCTPSLSSENVEFPLSNTFRKDWGFRYVEPSDDWYSLHQKLPVNQNRPSGNLLLATLNQKSYNLFVSRKHSSSL